MVKSVQIILAMVHTQETGLSSGSVTSAGLRVYAPRLYVRVEETSMGLDFRVSSVEIPWEECPHWTYSGFNSFREKLAEMIGMDLRSMVGFGGLDKWDEFMDEPICPFLNHSDCDGILTPDECKRVAPQLKELLEKLDDEDEWNKEQGGMLVNIMEIAAKEDRPLVFC